jgi:hypothetical protein
LELTSIGFFLEVAIVGAGATAWVSLAVLTFTGYRWITPALLEADGLLLLAIPTAVILGIIVDEIGDEVARLWKGRIREDMLGEDHADRLVTLRQGAFKSPYDRQALEYARKRLRIARGWVVNSAALTFWFIVFVYCRLPDSYPVHRISAIGAVGGTLLTVACVLATTSLLRSECHILASCDQGHTDTSTLAADASEH